MGGAAAQGRLSEKAGIENRERRRWSSSGRDAHRKRDISHSWYRLRFGDHKRGRGERGYLRQLCEIKRLRFRLEVHAAHKVSEHAVLVLFAGHLRIGHFAP